MDRRCEWCGRMIWDGTPYHEIKNSLYGKIIVCSERCGEEWKASKGQEHQAYEDQLKREREEFLARSEAEQEANNQAIIDRSVTVENARNSGYANYNKGNYDEAIKDFTKLCQLSLGDVGTYASVVDAYRMRGLAYGNKGRLKEAIQDFTILVNDKIKTLTGSYDPFTWGEGFLQGIAEPYNSRGWYYFHNGQFEEAVRDANEAIRFDSSYAVAYHTRGSAYAGMGWHEAAITDFKKALALEPNSPNSPNVSTALKNSEAAAKAGVKENMFYVEVNGEQKGPFGEAYIGDMIAKCELLGDTLVWHDGMTDWVKASSVPELSSILYQSALPLKSEKTIATFARVHQSNGNNHMNSGRYDEAISDYNEALRLFKNTKDRNANGRAECFSSCLSSRAWCYNYKGLYDEGINDSTEAMKLNSSNLNAYAAHANACSNKGDFDRAVADFNKWIKINPNDINAYIRRGNVYINMKDYDRALEDFKKCKDFDPNNADAYSGLGQAYLGKGNYDRAIGVFNQWIQFSPDNAIAYCNRGIAYRRKGDYDNAMADNNKYIQLAPNDTNAYNNRASVYNDKGEYDSAIADCDKAISINSSYANPYRHRAFAFMQKGNFAQARTDLNKALKINPNYKDAWTLNDELKRKNPSDTGAPEGMKPPEEAETKSAPVSNGPPPLKKPGERTQPDTFDDDASADADGYDAGGDADDETSDLNDIAAQTKAEFERAAAQTKAEFGKAADELKSAFSSMFGFGKKKK